MEMGRVGRARRARGSDVLGATPNGNWEGTNVIWRPRAIADVAAEQGLTADELAAEMEDARRMLFEIREGRVHPATDDKILTAWNALAIGALAEAGRVSTSRRTCRRRCDAQNSSDPPSRRTRPAAALMAERHGRAAGVREHAIMAAACLTLYETTFELRWYEEAVTLADELLRLFHDDERGGFFQTGSDAEELVLRPKELYDNATPSGNSVAAETLLRLSSFTGDAEYERAGLSALRLIRDAMAGAPTGFGQALCALDRYLGPSKEIAIVGDPVAADTRALAAVVTNEAYRPHMVLAVAAPDDEISAETVPLIRDRVARDGLATAYVCERFTCRLPVIDVESLREQLELERLR